MAMPKPMRERWFCGADLEDPELHTLGLGLAAVYTRRCPEAVGVNEDACAIVPFHDEAGVLVVADGAGGLPGGEQAAAIVIAALRDKVRHALRSGGELRSAILDGIDSAQQKVLKLGIGAATTVAIAEIDGHRLRTYHVGDSQVMLIGQKGKVKFATKCHSPVGYAIEAGLLDRDTAMTHSSRHMVSNLIGSTTMSIEISTPVEIAPKDTILIASDGLYDNLFEDQIIDICRKGQLLHITRSLVTACDAHMRSHLDIGKPDDLSLIAYRRRSML